MTKHITVLLTLTLLIVGCNSSPQTVAENCTYGQSKITFGEWLNKWASNVTWNDASFNETEAVKVKSFINMKGMTRATWVEHLIVVDTERATCKLELETSEVLEMVKVGGYMGNKPLSELAGTMILQLDYPFRVMEASIYGNSDGNLALVPVDGGEKSITRADDQKLLASVKAFHKSYGLAQGAFFYENEKYGSFDEIGLETFEIPNTKMILAKGTLTHRLIVPIGKCPKGSEFTTKMNKDKHLKLTAPKECQ